MIQTQSRHLENGLKRRHVSTSTGNRSIMRQVKEGRVGEGDMRTRDDISERA